MADLLGTIKSLRKNFYELIGSNYDRYDYTEDEMLPHRPSINTPIVRTDYNKQKARAIADTITNNANELVFNPKYNSGWSVYGAGTPNQPRNFNFRLKCNLANHYINASSLGLPEYTKDKRNLVNINQQSKKGNLIHASLLHKMLKNPDKYAAYTNGKITPIPKDLAWYAKGAIAVGGGEYKHVGTTMGDGSTVSAASEQGAVRNDWGFRNDDVAPSMQYGYILPKDIDANVLIEDAKERRRQHMQSIIDSFSPIKSFNKRQWIDPYRYTGPASPMPTNFHPHIYLPYGYSF